MSADPLSEVHTGSDVLEVISNLSSDEVFTPPKVVNELLDLLPDDVWSDPSLRWLDPGCKTGVFLREITKRLMGGLADTYPDEGVRLEHILKNMVFGVAITELTALMSRRSLYCSKDASSEHSVVDMGSRDGNVWFERLAHDFDVSGRCRSCSAARSQFGDIDKETHAYGFIHPSGQQRIKGATGMQFDVIVGNPPYQMDAESGNRTMPIYQHFVDEAKKLDPKFMLFVIPSRWMAGGLGLTDFRAQTLADKRFRKLVDYIDAGEVFPGVEIKGGVCYFLWDREYAGPCDVIHIRNGVSVGPDARSLDQFDVFVRDKRGLAILEKVLSHTEPSMFDIMAADKEFGMTSNFSGISQKQTQGSIPIYAIQGNRRITGWISRSEITKSAHLIDTHKVMIPQAYGAGDNWPHQILGQPFCAPSPSTCTQSYLFAYLDSAEEAESVESYVRTRFFRFLVSLRKISQHATRSTYLWVPQKSWDQKWTDDALYEEYDITADERLYIEGVVKEMPA
jgi:site-specific DNA-methyltransferase (adenine-specific)